MKATSSEKMSKDWNPSKISMEECSEEEEHPVEACTFRVDGDAKGGSVPWRPQEETHSRRGKVSSVRCYIRSEKVWKSTTVSDNWQLSGIFAKAVSVRNWGWKLLWIKVKQVNEEAETWVVNHSLHRLGYERKNTGWSAWCLGSWSDLGLFSE